MQKLMIFVTVFEKEEDSGPLKGRNIIEQFFREIASVCSLLGTGQRIEASSAYNGSSADRFSAKEA